MNVAINQFYLFKPKTGVRTGLIENINVNTGLQFSNYVSGVKSSDLFTQTMWDKMQTGAKTILIKYQYYDCKIFYVFTFW
jgi:hypothetical protein